MTNTAPKKGHVYKGGGLNTLFVYTGCPDTFLVLQRDTYGNPICTHSGHSADADELFLRTFGRNAFLYISGRFLTEVTDEALIRKVRALLGHKGTRVFPDWRTVKFCK